jgi:tRNA-dihydrouridine synthase
MTGRAHYGAPWIAGSIAHQAAGRTDERLPRGASELADYVVAHYQDMLSLYGIESGLRQARKHLGWYLDRHAEHAPAELRRTVLTATEPHIVIAALRAALIEGAPARELRKVA